MLSHKTGPKRSDKALCMYCDFQRTCFWQIKVHIDKKHPHHGTRQYPCDKCDKSFIFEATLKNHKSVQHAESFACKICSKQTSSHRSLKNHMADYHGDEEDQAEGENNLKKESNKEKEEKVKGSFLP